MPNGLIPEPTFIGEEGQYSEGNHGPEALKKDIGALAKMFNPGAVHTDDESTPGGIGTNNIQPGAITNELLSELFSIAASQIADLVTRVGNPGSDDKLPSEKAVRDAINLAQLSAGQYVKISGQELPITGWEESATSKAVELSFPVDGVTSANSAHVHFAVDSLDAALAAGVSGAVLAYDGGVRFFADAAPATPLEFDLIIF